MHQWLTLTTQVIAVVFRPFENELICIKGKNGGVCKGGSGGPLACKGNGQRVLRGGTSFGAQPTGVCLKKVPSVYARVSNY